MHEIGLWDRGRVPLTVLCLGAHSDDLEIGCAGTLMRLLAECRDVRCHWIVLSGGGSEERAGEARASAHELLGEAAAVVDVRDFRDAFFPYDGARVKEHFEEVKHRVQPDIVLTHSREDLHQDHRLVAELTWNTFRDHLILEYEVPKYDGGLGSPNLFVPLSHQVVAGKVQLLMTHFASQRCNQWFSGDTFRGLLRLRGLECNAPSGYAEAFYCRKVVV
jgi:LmbE family N-acetylglucosaminyl deacetylase